MIDKAGILIDREARKPSDPDRSNFAIGTLDRSAMKVGVVLRALKAILAFAVFGLAAEIPETSPAQTSHEGHRGVPILLYHRLGPVVADSMTVRTSRFEEQLDWLEDHHYTEVRLRTLVDELADPAAVLPRRAVAIVADDGHRSVYTQMWPIIRRRRIPLTLFIYPSAISNASYALTWDQIAEMKASGLVDIQSHTYWHPNFHQERKRLAPEAYRTFVLSQLVRSKAVLESRTGMEIDMLAWPFGLHDPELEELAREAGYRAGFTLDRRPAGHQADLLALPRYLMTDQDSGPRFEAIVEGSGR